MSELRTNILRAALCLLVAGAFNCIRCEEAADKEKAEAEDEEKAEVEEFEGKKIQTLDGKLILDAAKPADYPAVAGAFVSGKQAYQLKLTAAEQYKPLLAYNNKTVRLRGTVRNHGQYFVFEELVIPREADEELNFEVPNKAEPSRAPAESKAAPNENP